MSRRIYVASSWRNNLQPAIVALLRTVGHEVYDFRNPAPGDNGFAWSEMDRRWQQWEPAEFRDALAHPISDHGFANDYGAMEWADTGVLVLPCGRSAHLEAGYFNGARKELYILLLQPQEPELMYKMATQIVLSSAELVNVLKAPASNRHDSDDGYHGDLVGAGLY